MSRIANAALLIAATVSPPPGALAQETPDALTVADYERAEGRLASQVNPLVLGASVIPVWLEEGRFWYRNRFEGGTEYVIVDPAAGTRERAFDHARMAAALATATGEEYAAFALPFGGLALDAGTVRFEVEIEGETYACGLDPDRCQAVPAPEGTTARRFDIVSPDGTKAAFIRGHNLWLRDLSRGRRPNSPRMGSRTSDTRRTTRGG